MSENYKFFQNNKCEYFPCHKGIPEEDFNCLFCYCPLYTLGKNCGGNCEFLENGVNRYVIPAQTVRTFPALQERYRLRRCQRRMEICRYFAKSSNRKVIKLEEILFEILEDEN